MCCSVVSIITLQLYSLTDIFGQICSQGRSVNKAILTKFVKDVILVISPYIKLYALFNTITAQIPQQLGEHSSFLEETVDIDADVAATNCLQFVSLYHV